MGWEVIAGRGLGGTFDSSSTTWASDRLAWPVLHYGILVMLLKGGVFLFLLFLSFCLVRFWGMPREWYQNPYNLTAALLIPVYLSQFATTPLPFSVEGMPYFLGTMICFARFGKAAPIVQRKVLMGQVPAPEQL
jgi:hypothetical protein